VVAPASTDARDGLGPIFNAQSCASCHLLDGRGIPSSTGTGELGLLVRLSVPGVSDTGGPLAHPEFGDQIQDRSILGVLPEAELIITYVEQPGTYGDGSEYSLRVPTYELVTPGGERITDVLVSPRLAPQIVGMGLLEGIPETDIEAAADPSDADGDGISGRPNLVWNPATEQIELGRFGWKANAPTVEVQAGAAFNGDIGISSSIFPDQPCTGVAAESDSPCTAAPDGGEPELTDDRLASVTFYSRTLAVPAMRNVDDPSTQRGSTSFDELGCASCHTPTHTTGDDPTAALSNQTIFPYTDLLLHDMGAGLADNRPDFAADGQEWRTPPLWGIGLIADVNGERFLLHDGRARTIEEAILWHDGEGAAARDAFRTASRTVRDDLIQFLESL